MTTYLEGILNFLKKIETKQIIFIANIILYCIGTYLFIEHFSEIVARAVNVPYHDEWNFFDTNGLDTSLNWSWLFSFHNEHIITTTKLFTFLLYKLNQWDVRIHQIINFGIYIFTASTICYLIESRQKVPSGILFIILSSIIPWENHSWGFQVQFHFFVLFTFLGFYSLDSKYFYFSPIAMILSILSISAGVLFGFGYILYAGYLAYLYRERRVQYGFIIGLIALILISYLYSQPSLVGVPKTLPNELLFWNFYSNLVSLAFGFAWIKNNFYGYLYMVLITGIVLAYFHHCFWYERDEFNHSILTFFLLFSTTLTLAGITFSRAKMPSFFKTGRYAEVSILLLITSWIFIYKFIERKSLQKYLYIPALLIFFYPYRDDYRIDLVYIPQHYERKLLVDCMKKYYQTNILKCEDNFKDFVTRERLDRIKTLNLSIYREFGLSK